ncbi:MAG TPA: hypothetical protein V6D17_00730 [Candidatus Obscuribacterales bacterium]
MTGASGITEFGPSMIVLILVIFPAIDLIGLACGAATAALTARQCATHVATANNLDEALSCMSLEAKNLAQSGLGQFSRMQAVKGFDGCGADLYIKQTNVYSSQTTILGPNQGLLPPVDTANNVYEGTVRVSFRLGPLLDLSAVPGLDDVPGLGKPAELSLEWERLLEHPELFCEGNSLVNRSAGTYRGASSSSGSTGSSVLGSWNYPTGGQWQPMPGQKILQTEDITVNAQDAFWKETNIVVEQGNRLTFDFFARGTWRAMQGDALLDADGYSYYKSITNGLPLGCLIGRVGQNGNLFFVGKDQWNLTPPGTGKLYLMFNDDNFSLNDGTLTVQPGYVYWTDNSGSQLVRVYRTN